MPKIIEEKDKRDINKRKKAIFKNMPRSYYAIIDHFFPGKYTKDQIRNFRNNKTLNISILQDLEIIFQK